MTVKTFEIDLKGASPFEVFDGAGNVMFDARFAALKVAQFGSGSIAANTNGSISTTNAIADIILSRSRSSAAPLFLAGGNAGGMYSNFSHRNVLPSLSVFSSQMFGYWVTAYSDRVRFGNQTADFFGPGVGFVSGAMSYYYVILDNSVSN